MYDVEKRGDKPIYEYLYMCIRDDIVSGRIKGGEKLLSKRRLAQQEGVALITVENAYAQLLVEGYIESRERSGYYAVMDAGRFAGASGSKTAISRHYKISSDVKKDVPEIADFVSQRLHDDAFPLSREAAKQFIDLLFCSYVYASGRFIKNEIITFRCKPLGKDHFLLIPAA